MSTFDRDVGEVRSWFESPRFAGLRRLHTAREVMEQRGSIRGDYAVARDAAEAFHTRLRQLFADLGSLYLLMLGAVAIAIMLFAPRGVWGLLADRFGLQIFPLQRRLALADDPKKPGRLE